MKDPRIVIVLEGGLLRSVHSTQHIEYVVVDLDNDTGDEDSHVLGQPATADSVDDRMSLSALSKIEIPELDDVPDKEDHPWWKV